MLCILDACYATCAVCLHVRDHVPAVRHHPDALHEAEPGRQRRDYTKAHTGMSRKG
jgi:hypothetical protein